MFPPPNPDAPVDLLGRGGHSRAHRLHILAELGGGTHGLLVLVAGALLLVLLLRPEQGHRLTFFKPVKF